ncbi:GPI-anchored mannoprotein [Ancistrocladus abbreviatus]
MDDKGKKSIWFINVEIEQVLDYIEDSGLEALATSCKDLQELRVSPSYPFGAEPNVTLTERGLVSVSEGCPKLNSVLYFCCQMTNAALVTIAKNCSHIVRFHLCILETHTPDYLTLQTLNIGFGAIVEHCKELSLSAFAGNSDLGLHHMLSGCQSLRKLEIRDSPFGDKALLANAEKLETMPSLWMSSCLVSFQACKLLSQKMPRLNVEVLSEREPVESISEGIYVEKLYICRTVAGARFDVPGFIWNRDKIQQ